MLHPDNPDPTDKALNKKIVMAAPGRRRRKMSMTEQEGENTNAEIIKTESMA